jgi:hypothetical protein
VVAVSAGKTGFLGDRAESIELLPGVQPVRVVQRLRRRIDAEQKSWRDRGKADRILYRTDALTTERGRSRSD